MQQSFFQIEDLGLDGNGLSFLTFVGFILLGFLDLELFLLLPLGGPVNCSAVKITVSKTSFKLCSVNAEHST